MSCHIPLEELRLLQRRAVREAAEGVTLTSVAPALVAEEGAETHGRWRRRRLDPGPVTLRRPTQCLGEPTADIGAARS